MRPIADISDREVIDRILRAVGYERRTGCSRPAAVIERPALELQSSSRREQGRGRLLGSLSRPRKPTRARPKLVAGNTLRQGLRHPE